MGRPKIHKDAVRVSVIMPKSLREHVEKQAARIGISESKPITVNEAIRRAIKAVYPLPKQEMFEF